jgi:predicted PurR-regulated permease PerM
MSADFYRKSFVVIVVGLVAYALWRMLEPCWAALVWAAFLAFLLHPLHRRMTRRFGGRAGLSAGILTVAAPIALVGPLTLFGFAFASQVGVLIEYLQRGGLHFDAAVLVRMEQWPVIGHGARWARENVSVTAEELQRWLLAGAQSLLKSLAAASGNIVLSALGTVLAMILTLFVLFFMLRDGRTWYQRAVRLIPLPAERRAHLLAHLGNTTRAVVMGTGVTALVQGLLVGIGFAIAGLPSPVVFGVLAATLALLPAGGAGIVWVPAVCYLLVTSHWGAGIFLAIWGAGVSLSDNFLRPVLISRHTPMSTLTVFIGVVGGVSAFGLIGVVVGPVFLTLVAAIFGYAEEMVRENSAANSSGL